MADNFKAIVPSTGDTFRATDNAGVKTPHHNVDTIAQPTALVHNQKTVTTAGSAVALVASSTPITSVVIIKALASNGAGFIYVGGSGVSASNGLELAAGEQIAFPIDDLQKVYLDASANGLGVSYLAS